MMTILRYLLAILLVITLIHLFEVFNPGPHFPVATVSSDTLLALDSINSMKRKYFNLKVAESFWRNRIQLASDPSFILTADLNDSLITLDLQGVPLHMAKIGGIQLSQGINDSLYQSELLDWISAPFKLKSQTATISKEPIQERYIASRREAESQLIHLRDPEDSNYVSITLVFNRNLTLILKEIESDSVNYPIYPEIMRGSEKMITLYMRRLDALAIYRALPQNTSMILNI